MSWLACEWKLHAPHSRPSCCPLLHVAAYGPTRAWNTQLLTGTTCVTAVCLQRHCIQQLSNLLRFLCATEPGLQGAHHTNDKPTDTFTAATYLLCTSTGWWLLLQDKDIIQNALKVYYKDAKHLQGSGLFLEKIVQVGRLFYQGCCSSLTGWQPENNTSTT